MSNQIENFIYSPAHSTLNHIKYLIKVQFLLCLSLPKAGGCEIIETELKAVTKLLQLVSIPPKWRTPGAALDSEPYIYVQPSFYPFKTE